MDEVRINGTRRDVGPPRGFVGHPHEDGSLTRDTKEKEIKGERSEDKEVREFLQYVYKVFYPRSKKTRTMSFVQFGTG